MRRPLRIVFAAVLVGLLVLCMLTMRTTPARVFAKNERIHVMQSTGQWYHDYSVLVGVVDSTSHGRPADTLSLTVGGKQYDAARVGAHLRLHQIVGLRRFAWASDSSSAWQTLVWLVEAHVKSYARPAPISPLQTQMAGLARVVAVHSVERRRFFWQKNEKTSNDRSHWMHLVEVEFWAPRVRGVVRTIDVIDAGSIPGLHPGDILQMHFDQREPRVLRLDDGMRTFSARKP